MPRTIVGLNAPNAVKRYSASLWVEASQQAYWSQRFFGRGDTAKMPIQVLTELQSDAGEQISYDLLMSLRMAPVVGDDVLEGKEEALRFSTDRVYIDQFRVGVNAGGRMTRKRTLHDLRGKARIQQADWWARFMDELCFIYISGARGSNDNYILGDHIRRMEEINPITPPDARHHFYGGAATDFSNMAADDKMSISAIDRLIVRAQTQGGWATGIPMLQPCMYQGAEQFVLVMHPWQEDDLRKEIGDNTWSAFQRALTTAVGNKSNIFIGGLGMYRNVVLHSHRNAICFGNAGATGDVQAARALFLGAQAGVMAFGSPGTGNRIDWYEESRDNGNQIVISSNAIFGIKKSTFDVEGEKQDLGVFALDTAAAKR